MATLIPTTPPQERTLSIKQACEEVGVCRRTIYNWVNSGKVLTLRTAGGSLRILHSSLWREELVK